MSWSDFSGDADRPRLSDWTLSKTYWQPVTEWSTAEQSARWNYGTQKFGAQRYVYVIPPNQSRYINV